MSRLVFAHQLRAVAVLSVLASHLIGVYWVMPDVVTWLTHTPAPPHQTPTLLRWIAWPHWQPGPFGVSLFFLISGFVIPISLEEHTATWRFLLARALRIYPVAICGQMLGLILVHLALFKAPPPWWPGPMIATNLLLVYDWFGYSSLDTVNWSLCVELKFYVLAAAVAPLIRKRSPVVVPALSLLCLGIAALTGRTASPRPFVVMAGQDAVYLSYMLLGVLFYFRLRGGSAASFLLGLVGCGALTCLTWSVSPLKAQFPIVTMSYGMALALFAAAYALRRFARPIRPLDALATVSYPIYMIHSVTGYLVLRLGMTRFGLSYNLSLLLALIIVGLLATAMHTLVEKPSIRWGKMLRDRRLVLERALQKAGSDGGPVKTSV